MLWLVREPSFARLLTVDLWLSFIYGSYNGAMVVFLTEIMLVDVRTSGFALAYSMATAIFGGFTPALGTCLIHISGNRAIPGLWLFFAAACRLAATLLPSCTLRNFLSHNPSQLDPESASLERFSIMGEKVLDLREGSLLSPTLSRR